MLDTEKKMSQPSIAVIMTCHNRRDTTLNCLQALYEQKVSFQVYLVDDGSSDGTSVAISQKYPDVTILQGDGNLYWGGGMRLAFAEALKHQYEYYLWLNDDTMLEPKAIENLLNIYSDLVRDGISDSIIVGSTKDPVTGEPTYGGAISSKHWYTKKFEFVKPDRVLQECDTMFGNCVLIPNSVASKVGNIDSSFIHSMGDLDYGLRARKAGCSIWAAPWFIGTCSRNPIDGSWVDTNINPYKRLKKAFQSKNFPFKSWTVFCKRYSGLFWFMYWPLPYVRSLIGYRNMSISSSPYDSKN